MQNVTALFLTLYGLNVTALFLTLYGLLNYPLWMGILVARLPITKSSSGIFRKWQPAFPFTVGRVRRLQATARMTAKCTYFDEFVLNFQHALFVLSQLICLLHELVFD